MNGNKATVPHKYFFSDDERKRWLKDGRRQSLSRGWEKEIVENCKESPCVLTMNGCWQFESFRKNRLHITPKRINKILEKVQVSDITQTKDLIYAGELLITEHIICIPPENWHYFLCEVKLFCHTNFRIIWTFVDTIIQG